MEEKAAVNMVIFGGAQYVGNIPKDIRLAMELVNERKCPKCHKVIPVHHEFPIEIFDCINCGFKVPAKVFEETTKLEHERRAVDFILDSEELA